MYSIEVLELSAREGEDQGWMWKEYSEDEAQRQQSASL